MTTSRYWNCPSPDRPGDWDLLQLIRRAPRRSNPILTFLEMLYPSSAPVRPNPASGPVPFFLHRVDDLLVVQYFDITSQEDSLPVRIGRSPVPATATVRHPAPPGPRSAELVTMARVLVACYPKDLHVRILLLDALIRTREGEELARTTLAVRARLLTDGRWPNPVEPDALAPLLPDGIPPDPFSLTSGPLSLILDPVSDTMIVSSLGPDGCDDRGMVEYDATNGTLSARPDGQDSARTGIPLSAGPCAGGDDGRAGRTVPPRPAAGPLRQGRGTDS